MSMLMISSCPNTTQMVSKTFDAAKFEYLKPQPTQLGMKLNLLASQDNDSGQKFFLTKQFGPFPVGHTQDKSHAHGYGRIAKITFASNCVDTVNSIIAMIEKSIIQWFETQWSHRILIAADDVNVDLYRTLHELGCIDVNVMAREHGPELDPSCRFAYDGVDGLVRKLSSDLCWVQGVELWEHHNHSFASSHYPV